MSRSIPDARRRRHVARPGDPSEAHRAGRSVRTWTPSPPACTLGRVPTPQRQRVFYRIGEVARLVGVTPQVLRHWEAVLGVPEPMKTTGSHRHYRRHDVELAMRVRAMLEREGLTLLGVKKRLAAGGEREKRPSDRQTVLRSLRAELEALLETTAAIGAARARRRPLVVPVGSERGS